MECIGCRLRCVSPCPYTEEGEDYWDVGDDSAYEEKVDAEMAREEQEAREALEKELFDE